MPHIPADARLWAQLEHLEAELEMTAAAVPSSTRVYRLLDRVRRLRREIEQAARAIAVS